VVVGLEDAELSKVSELPALEVKNGVVVLPLSRKSPRSVSVLPPFTTTCPVFATEIAGVVLLAPLAPIIQFWSSVSVTPSASVAVSPLPGMYVAPVQPVPFQWPPDAERL
jgi:hypothetical protein